MVARLFACSIEWLSSLYLPLLWLGWSVLRTKGDRLSSKTHCLGDALTHPAHRVRRARLFAGAHVGLSLLVAGFQLQHQFAHALRVTGFVRIDGLRIEPTGLMFFLLYLLRQ